MTRTSTVKFWFTYNNIRKDNKNWNQLLFLNKTSSRKAQLEKTLSDYCSDTQDYFEKHNETNGIKKHS